MLVLVLVLVLVLALMLDLALVLVLALALAPVLQAMLMVAAVGWRRAPGCRTARQRWG